LIARSHWRAVERAVEHDESEAAIVADDDTHREPSMESLGGSRDPSRGAREWHRA